ncbi:hypothetical protein MPSEU_000755700 [Mayamaea pseudoterrestris]|nr:hypothetical protein MPSEU_000755700 [Mayamaea pseudoterrestris]
MQFIQAAVSNCFQDLSEFQQASRDGSAKAVELGQLISSAQTRAESASNYSNQVMETLQSFGKIDATLFVKIQDLIQRGTQEKNLYIDMEQSAREMTVKAKDLTETLQKGIDSLPQLIQDELADDDEQQEATTNVASRSVTGDKHAAGASSDTQGNEDANQLRQLLSHIDNDVDETQTMSRGMQDMDIFSAATKGKDAYRGVLQKKQVCSQLLDHLQKLGRTVTEQLQLLAGNSGSTCCDQLTGLYARAKALLQCLKYSKLIQSAIDAVQKLLQSIVQFATTAWNKFTGFLDEFDAAKKLGRLVGNMPRPLKNSKMGQSAMEFVGGMLGQR